jgi:hypothetical protein
MLLYSATSHVLWLYEVMCQDYIILSHGSLYELMHLNQRDAWCDGLEQEP